MIYARFIAAATILATTQIGLASEKFTLAQTPGKQDFWHVQRADADRAVIAINFADTYALTHADRIATPVVGAEWADYGVAGMSGGEFRELLRDYQASCAIHSREMITSFTVEARPENLERAVDLCARLLREPALRGRDLERIKENAVIARASLPDNRAALATWLMRQHVDSGNAFSRWDDPLELARVSADDVKPWLRETFARDNATIVAVGPFDATTAASLIERIFNQLPATAAPRVKRPERRFDGRAILFERAGDQTAIRLSNAPEYDISDAMPASIANNILGGGLERRLSRAVRGELGATYGIGSSLGSLDATTREFTIQSLLANELAAAGLKRTREEYQKWRTEGVTAEEVAAARALLASTFERTLETPSGKATTLLTLLASGRTADDEAAYGDRMRAISVDDVNRVLHAAMPEKLTSVIVAPSADGLGADCVIKKLEDIRNCQ